MKIKELLKNESCWAQDTYARNAKGEHVPVNSSDAVCWDLVGAIAKCYPHNCIRMHEKFRLALNRESPFSLASWNDTHHWEEVKTLLEKMDV